MALSNLQERLERSLFEEIRVVLVREGYIPDIADTTKYGDLSTIAAQQTWDAELDAIQQAKGFAVEIYNHSQTKGAKHIPRIVIIPRRTMPGETGAPPEGVIVRDPEVGGGFLKWLMPLQSSNFHFDIHLVANTAKQGRILNAVLSAALGMMKSVPYYDDRSEFFLVKQYNYYDLPDPMEGIEEYVYSYECPEMWDISGDPKPIVPIEEIKVEDHLVQLHSKFPEDGSVGDATSDGNVTVTKDNIKINP